MENQNVGTFQAVVVRDDSSVRDNMYIIDTRNGNQYHRSHLDGKMYRCNVIDEWEKEGKREFSDLQEIVDEAMIPDYLRQD